MENQTENVFNYYKYHIYNFENYIYNYKYPNSNEIVQGSGYLINLKNYKQFKEIIDYNNYNINFQNNIDYDYYQNLFNNINNNEDIIISLNQIKFRTSDYLVNMLLNGNEYILIHPELWKIVGNKEKQNEPPIVYQIINKQILFTLDVQMPFIFNLNDSKKFIIEKSTFANIDNFYSNYNIIMKIYIAIKNYYQFEKDFSIKLKQDENYLEEEKYYVISKNWIDEWKICSKYEIIKKLIEKENFDEHNIRNQIIDYQKQNNYNYKFDELKIINFNNKEEMKNYLQKDSFAIVNKEFCSSFDLFDPNCFMRCKIYNNIISIIIGQDILSFKSDNNIISQSKKYLSSIKISEFKHLKQLLKIYFFQKELKEKINIPHNTSKNNEENNIYLIDKKTIDKYKDFFQYKKLLEDLENNNRTNFLNYQNYESNLEIIMRKYIKEDYINNYKQLQNNINSIKDFNNYSFNVLQYPFKNNLKYIKDFEIINKDIELFFKENRIFENEKFIEGKYIGEAQKIFIIFEYQSNHYYELGFFDLEGNLQIEYLIEETRIDYNQMIINYFKRFDFENIYKFFLLNENKNNFLFLEEKIIGNFYKIEENNKIQNDNNIENTQNYQNNKFILDIISSLISLYFFENNLIYKIIESSEKNLSNNNSSNTYAMDSCFLVNKNFISTFKKMFSYQEIENIINSNNITLNSTIDQ